VLHREPGLGERRSGRDGLSLALLLSRAGIGPQRDSVGSRRLVKRTSAASPT
jgi:hypothetical protein